MDDPTERGSGLRLALDVWRRRKWLAIAVFVGTFTAVVSAVTFLPDVYRSTATVLVERQQVPETLVRSSVTGELETRLHTIRQEILSRARLSALITRFDLYPDLRKRLPPEAVVERMRRDIQLELKGAEQSWGRNTTIAFALTYGGRDPETVARVTNALASFYVEENLRIRERQVSGTAEFLRAQLVEAKKKLDEQERRTGDFKLRHVGELPKQVEVNLARLERLNERLRLNSERQMRVMERREALARQPAETGAPGQAPDPDATTARIARLNQQLAELRTRFSDKYPDVIRVKAEIAALERKLAEAGPEGGREAEPAVPADPARRRLEQPVRQPEAELKGLKEEENRLLELIATYERRIENAPKREQEFQEIGRDYETTKELYASLLKRYEEAQLAESAEQGQKGEQFRILDPAISSKQPAAPNRFRLILMGLLLSFGLAAGAAVLAETLDTSFHTVDDLRAFTKVPVLVSIPRIDTEADAGLRLQRLSLAAASLVIGLALIAGASYYVAHENEQLVGMLARGRS